MSLYTFGGISIEVADSTQLPRAATLGAIAKRVARAFNGEGDPVIEQHARDSLIQIIDELDLFDHFAFGTEQQSDVALVYNTATYDLTSRFFGFRGAMLIYTAAGAPLAVDEGKLARELKWVGWKQAQQNWPETDLGTPSHVTMRNPFADSLIEVRPLPDAAAAANYTLRVHHYTRIDYPSNSGSVLVAPRQVNSVWEAGGKYMMAMDLSDNRAGAYYAAYQQMLGWLRGLDKRLAGSRSAAWRMRR